MSTRWKVTLNNQHAQCGYVGFGRLRSQAFLTAMRKASLEFLNYKRPDGLGWQELFDGALKAMGHKTTRANYADPRGFNVTIERMPHH